MDKLEGRRQGFREVMKRFAVSGTNRQKPLIGRGMRDSSRTVCGMTYCHNRRLETCATNDIITIVRYMTGH